MMTQEVPLDGPPTGRSLRSAIVLGKRRVLTPRYHEYGEGRLGEETRSRTREMLSSGTTWVFLGFALSYVLFFVYPVFLSRGVMHVPEYLPIAGRSSIGGDIRMELEAIRDWITLGKSWDRMFPAVSAIIFAPLAMLPFSAAYLALTAITIACYAFWTILAPARVNGSRALSPLLTLIVATGLTSYGLQFEIERGQWNIVAMSLALASIWLFRKGGRPRLLAYVLLTLAVQLKLWPLIFMLMLVDDWDAWKANLARWGTIVAVNAGLLFVLGLQGFSRMGQYVAHNTAKPRTSVVTHSVSTFVQYLESVLTGSTNGLPLIFTRSIEAVLLVLVVGCVVGIALVARSRRERGVNPHLLLACTLGACLITPVSNDYKLSILAIPLALLLARPEFPGSPGTGERAGWGFSATVLLLAFAYSSTLFSYANKPPLLANNGAALLVMLFAVTILYVRFPGGAVSTASSAAGARVGFSVALVSLAFMLLAGASISTVAYRPLQPDVDLREPSASYLKREVVLFSNFSKESGYSRGEPASFTLARGARLTGVNHYHYNGGHGAPPGTIWMRNEKGDMYGPWRPMGVPGHNDAPNAYWMTFPGILLPPGTYTLYDSDPLTWSQNVTTGGQGMVEVYGVPQPR